jgi:hypothetical protein
VDDPISRWTILRDVAWIGLSLFVIAFDRGVAGVDQLLAGRSPQ